MGIESDVCEVRVQRSTRMMRNAAAAAGVLIGLGARRMATRYMATTRSSLEVARGRVFRVAGSWVPRRPMTMAHVLASQKSLGLIRIPPDRLSVEHVHAQELSRSVVCFIASQHLNLI
jgi:hypothetical protein